MTIRKRDDDDERKVEEGLNRRRRYFINMRDPKVAPKLAPGINAIIEYLETYGETRWKSVVSVGVEFCDCTMDTIDTKMHAAVKAGMLRKRGRRKSAEDDTRTLELIDWPKPAKPPCAFCGAPSTKTITFRGKQERGCKLHAEAILAKMEGNES